MSGNPFPQPVLLQQRVLDCIAVKVREGELVISQGSDMILVDPAKVSDLCDLLKKMASEQMHRTREDGYKAARQGKQASDCPHPRLSAEHSEWMAGYDGLHTDCSCSRGGSAMFCDCRGAA